MLFKTKNILFLLCFPISTLLGQNIDSLGIYLTKANDYFANESLDSAQIYSQKIIDHIDFKSIENENINFVNQSYYILGRSFSKQNKHDDSEITWKKYLKWKRSIDPNNKEEIFSIRCDLATTYFYASKQEEMKLIIDSLNQDLSVYDYPHFHQAYLKMLEGQFLSFSNNYSNGLDLLSESMELFQTPADSNSIEMIRCIYQKGLNHYYLGQYDAALKTTKYALSKTREKFGENSNRAFRIIQNIGLYYWAIGDLNQGRINLESYVRHVRSQSESALVQLAPAYINLGLICSAEGKINKSIYYYQAAEKLWLEAYGKDHGQLIYPYINLASEYFVNDNHKESLKYVSLLNDMNLDPEGPWKQVYLAGKLIEAQILSENNEHNKVIEAFKEIDLSHSKDQPINWQRRNENLVAMSKVLIKANLDSEAEANLQRVLLKNKGREKDPTNLNSVAYDLLANISLKRYDWKQAIQMSDKALATLNYQLGDPSFVKINNLVTLIERLGYRLEIHYQHYKIHPEIGTDALEQITSTTKLALQEVSRQFGDETEKISIREKFRIISERLMECLIAINGPNKFDDILNIMELNKNNSLVAEINQEKAQENASVDEKLLALDQTYKNQLDELRLKIFQSEGENKHEKSLNKIFTDSILLITSSRDSIFNVLKQDYPLYFNMVYGSGIPKINDLQNNFLTKDDLLLQYFVGDSSIYNLAIDKDSVWLEQQKIDTNFYVATTDLINGLKSPSSNSREIKNLSCQVYDYLIPKNIIDQGDFKNIFIINDGIANYIPFEILSNTCELNTGSTLSDKYSISYYVSSSLALKQNKESNKQQYAFNGFAATYDFDPILDDGAIVMRSDGIKNYNLPAAKEEITSVHNLVGGNYYLGEDATETNFKNQANQMGLIHLSLHGHLSDYYPMESGLLFSSTDTLNDGILKTAEIYALNLDTELAVLSACETGIGELKRGEGLQSISRAFTYAGARSTMYSLWKIPDNSTKKIMVEFYKGLKDGLRKDEALRQAKERYLENTIEPQERYPYYWAGFVIQGNMDPINFVSKTNVKVWALGTLLIGLMAFLFISRKGK